MRNGVFGLALIGCFLSGDVWAQFGNRSLGLSGGYLSIVDPSIEWGIPIQLENSIFLEDGWESTFRVPLMILQDKVLNRQVVATGGNVGLRYLFTQEAARLYAGAEVTFLYIFRDNGQTTFVGVAPNAGLDVFVSDSFSIGARGTLNVYLALNEPVRLAPSVLGVISTYF